MINFLAFYRNIAHIHTDKELNRRFSKVKETISTLFKQNKLIVKTNTELQSYDFNKIGMDTFVYSKKDTKTLCLLRHIRNSIAHWNINFYKKEHKYFVIQDYNQSGGQTAYGIISIETFTVLLGLQ